MKWIKEVNKLYIFLAIIIMIAFFSIYAYVNSEFAVSIISEEISEGVFFDADTKDMGLLNGEKYYVYIKADGITQRFNNVSVYSGVYLGDSIPVKIQEYKRPFREKDYRLQLIFDDNGFVILD